MAKKHYHFLAFLHHHDTNREKQSSFQSFRFYCGLLADKFRLACLNCSLHFMSNFGGGGVFEKRYNYITFFPDHERKVFGL